MKKTPAERSFVSALCRILVLIQFRLSEQGAIKLMRRLLNNIFESVSTERDLVKELKRMSDRLTGLDKHPDEELSQDEANLIFGKFLTFRKFYNRAACANNPIGAFSSMIISMVSYK